MARDDDDDETNEDQDTADNNEEEEHASPAPPPPVPKAMDFASELALKFKAKSNKDTVKPAPSSVDQASENVAASNKAKEEPVVKKPAERKVTSLFDDDANEDDEDKNDLFAPKPITVSKKADANPASTAAAAISAAVKASKPTKTKGLFDDSDSDEGDDFKPKVDLFKAKPAAEPVKSQPEPVAAPKPPSKPKPSMFGRFHFYFLNKIIYFQYIYFLFHYR